MRFRRKRPAAPPADHQRILGDIGRLLRVSADHPSDDDDVLVAALEEAGTDLRTARRLVQLVPIAFGRPVLAHFGVTAPDRYQARWPPDFAWVDRSLRAEPEYRAASDHLSDFAGLPGFTQLATRSAEVHALNSALLDGQDPKGGASAVVITWWAAEDDSGG